MKWLVGVVMVVGLPVLLADLNDVNVCQWLARRLIHHAAQRLPKRDRSRWEEEWLRHNDDLPGRLLPLARALKIYFQAASYGWILRGSPSVSQALRARMRAVRQRLRLRPKPPASGPEPAGQAGEAVMVRDVFEFEGVLRAAAGGDEKAFTVIWRNFQPGLLRYLRVVAPAAAEGLASETWIDVIRGLARFEGTEANFRAWVFTIARNRVTTWRRRTAP